MYFDSKSGLIGCGLAALLALSPVRATEVLFDNGEAIDNAGLPGGNGYSSNLQSNQQVYDNFAFSRDSSIESVRFQMAGGTEPFRFSVYTDDAGTPGAQIFALDLEAGDYRFGPATEYLNGVSPPDIGHDFSFDLPNPLTLPPGSYWLSFLGTGNNLFRTLGSGEGDGFAQRQIRSGQLSGRPGNTPFRLIGQPVDDAVAVIDIKPESDDNSINPRSNGVIPVAVLGSIDFDATQIRVSTVIFGPDAATPEHNGHVEDVNNDGFMDMLFHFTTRESGIQCGDTEAFLRGEIFDGQSFGNLDSITTIGCGAGDSPDDPIVVDDGGIATGGDAGGTALDWIMLAGLGALALLGFYRRRLTDR
jgi:hypothetical protein